ncbi:transcriptional regulator, LysR family [Stigmatella aurantiaca]|uniref:Transcriptional regulator, LysR family n=1 Tax=Stigmatella aurantiaca TaxID=41 RepID=A0A1H8DFG3_STIAU|nr:LysR family transcriptional regulator [Stigmatella aurantiaca]SEN05916.1 transcriptional regulator, LysR family [Stigmatella aurantiaca]
MLDAITLDQLRTFVAVVDEGSFSAAGRKLRRVQSAVSHAMANLETQLGVQLWDRSTKIPTLTGEGTVLLAAARRICADVDAFKRMAEGFVEGLESSIALAVDALLPVRALVDLCREFSAKFPSVQLRLYTDTLSAVSELVLEGTCQLGVVGPAAQTQGLERQHLSTVRMIPVAAKNHPLAQLQGPVPTQVLAEYVNIVLSERGGSRQTADQGLLSSNVWRVADLHTKHAFLRAGLGWGNMPEHLVQEELASGQLVRLRPAAWGEDQWVLSLSIVYRPDLSKGPATRWLLERMTELCLRDIGPPQPGPSP